MVKTFSQAVDFLEKYIPSPDKKHPGELGIKRMRYFMDMLGNPQLRYPTIHVGGTSGKGSTATFIASILSTKYKVGLHTSPHLVKITERIKLNGTDITNADFIRLANEIKPAIDKVKLREFGPPSYFEIIAAMAFLYFKEQKADFAVIEVGMGGRYDATNVIKPLAAVLTNVGLDHTEILGDTVEKIAQDKAGIIKSGIYVVTGAKQPSVITIIKVKGEREQATVSLLGKDFSYKIKKMSEEGSVFDYKGVKSLKNLKIRLLGEYQVENAALAIRAVEKFSNSQIEEGLKKAFIPGRLEIVGKNPLVILDGAHNPDKVRALVSSIKKIFPKKKITTILAIKSDKNAREMLTQLSKISQRMIFTAFQLKGDVGIISSYSPKELLRIAQAISKDIPMSVIENAEKAVKDTVQSAQESDLILVTGSLYLVGEVRKFLIND